MDFFLKEYAMLDIRQIDDEYAVTGLVDAADLDRIKELGFKSLVCHRPDHEAPDQALYADIEARAAELGLDIRHIPVTAAGMSAENVTAMVDALDDFPRPMLGFCRSGARSTAVYQQALRMRD